MKLNTERNEVERIGVSGETEFRIKTTKKMFDILSSGIYTDPKLAVVREISCNAYDAHVAAGCPEVPFEIHLPNDLEPWFSVRDYGTGLDHQQVITLYTTYGESTKTDSNDFIGALGLGSKSPFSYTKAFEVVSRFNGMRRIYSAFINEDGKPTCAPMGEFKTDEGNGLEVRITVQRSDFRAFHEKTASALRWFKVKPRVVGTPHFQFEAIPKENLSGEGWMLFKNNFSTDHTRMTAVQGNVAYKVDISKLNLDQVDQRLLGACHIVGFFPIGDLEFAASREEIRYDARSIANLVACIKRVRDGIRESVEQKVNAISNQTFWKQMIFLNKLADEMFYSYSLFVEFIRTSNHPVLIRYTKQKDGKMSLPSMRGWSVTGYGLTRAYTSDNATMRRNEFRGDFEPREDMVVFINDVKLGGVGKIHHFLREKAKLGQWLTALVLRKEEDTKDIELDPKDHTKIVKETAWTEEQFEDEYDKLFESLGEVELLSSSTLEAAPRKKAAYKGLPVFQLEGVAEARYGDGRLKWKRISDFDPSVGGLYFDVIYSAHVAFVNGVGEEQSVSWRPDDTPGYLAAALDFINHALNTSYEMKDVYGFGLQAAKKIRKLSNWINIFDVLKLHLDKSIDAVRYTRAIDLTSDTLDLNEIVRSKRGEVRVRNQILKRINALDNKSTFKQTIAPFMTDVEKYQKVTNLAKLMERVAVDLKSNVFDNIKVEPYFVDKDLNKYPMLKYVGTLTYKGAAEVDVIFDYIETIDRS